jgi:hypothetical protein
MDSAPNDVSTALRPKLMPKETDTEDIRLERSRRRIALDHAIGTIKKVRKPKRHIPTILADV